VTSDAATSMVGTIAVAERDKLDLDALGAWMTDNVAGYAGPLTYAKFAGGQSNPTYRLDTPSRAYVLRRKPFGPILPSAHAVDREYRVIAGLHPTGFPVPRPYGLCEDPDVIGSAFYVMEMVEGRTIWDGSMPGATPSTASPAIISSARSAAGPSNIVPPRPNTWSRSSG
jgi:aminoglycoside phosphotransferase (APT) family kinase protein